MNKKVTINARKYDGSIHRSWNCIFLGESEDYWQFIGIFNQEIIHSELGIIKVGTLSYEYYYKQKWFNVFRFHEPDGQLKYFYCNINFPPTFENNILEYIDLDLDILVKPDHSYKILDRNEFYENSIIYKYPNSIKSEVEQQLKILLDMITNNSFPFNYHEQSENFT